MRARERWDRWTRLLNVSVVVTAIVAAVFAALAVDALAKTSIRLPLTPTANAPGASGVAKLVMRTPSHGKLTIKVRRLAHGKSFDVLVNKVKVGALQTGPNGGGTARFSTSPAGNTRVLGFTPQGTQIEIRDHESGDDDLDANVPDDHPDSAIGCCVGDDDGEVECDALTAAECASHGGTPTTVRGCLPDPCNNNPPPPTVVCCHVTSSTDGAFTDDDPETECDDDASSAECAAEGGMVVQATSCDPNPCQPPPPPNLVVCCVSQGDQGEQEGEPQTEPAECEHITADRCQAAGGTVSMATSCDSHPCGGGGGDGDGGSGSGD